MKSYEVLARRYCALLGEDPDEVIEGIPAWRIALVDLEAAIDALHTFGVDARAPMSDEDYKPRNRTAAPSKDEPRPKSDANVAPFRRVA